MLEDYQLKPETVDELKVVLQTIWKELPKLLTPLPINKVEANFTKRLIA